MMLPFDEEESVGLLQSDKQWEMEQPDTLPLMEEMPIQEEPVSIQEEPMPPIENAPETPIEAPHEVDKWRVDGTIPKALFAINNAEMGGVDNLPITHMVRTSHAPEGGSTAYGPYQMTTSLVKLYKNNKEELFTADEMDYLNRFIDQGEKFNMYGNNPHYDVDTTTLDGYDSRYDYGGEGDLTSPEDMKLYQSVASKIFEDHLAKTGGNVEEAIADWRDSSRDTYFEKDTRYRDVVRKALENPEGYEDWKKYVFQGEEYTPITPTTPDYTGMDHGVVAGEVDAWGRFNEMHSVTSYDRTLAELDNWDSVIADEPVVDTLKQWWSGGYSGEKEEMPLQFDAMSGSFGKDGGNMNVETAMGRNFAAPVENAASQASDYIKSWVDEGGGKNGKQIRDFLVGDMQRGLDVLALGNLTEGTNISPELMDLALSMPFGLATKGKVLLRGRKLGTEGKALSAPRELGSHHTDGATPGVASYFAEHQGDLSEIAVRRFKGDYPLQMDDSPSGLWNPEYINSQLVKLFPENKKTLEKFFELSFEKPMKSLNKLVDDGRIDVEKYSIDKETLQSAYHKKVQKFIKDQGYDNVEYDNKAEGGIGHIIFDEKDFEDIALLNRVSDNIYQDEFGRMFKFNDESIIDLETNEVLDLDKYADEMLGLKSKTKQPDKLEDGVYQDDSGNIFTVKNGNITSL